MQHLARILGGCLVSAAGAAAQFDSPLFGGLESPLGVTLFPVSLLLVDVDGDGHADAVLGREDSPGAHVALGDPHGGFAPPVEWGSSFPLDFLAGGDVDGDGDADVVGISDYGPYNTLLNLGGAAFGFVQTAQPCQQISGLALADMDGDGTLDAVLATGAFIGVIEIAHGAGDGHFTASTFAGPLGYTDGLRLADVDGNGALDPIIAKSTGLAFYPHDGAGQLGAPRHVEVGDAALELEVLDLQGDGVPDLAAITQPLGLPLAPRSLAVVVNEGQGQFAAPVSQELGFLPDHLRAGDVVGGAAVDLVALTSTGSLVAAFEGDGAGGLLAPQTGAVPQSSRAFALDDRDGDGRLDVVVAGRDRLFELRGTLDALGPPRCVLTEGRGPQRPALGDLDGDDDGDVVVALFYDEVVNVLLGDGTGLLGAPVAYPASTWTRDAVLLDLDADGDLDVVCAMESPFRILRLLNDGHGVLGPPATFLAALASGTTSPRVADVDEDGQADVVAGSYGGLINLFLGNGTGGFAAAQGVPTGGPSSQAIDVAPLDDGDAHVDILVASFSGTTSRVLHGDGLGGFGPPLSIDTSVAGSQRDIVAARLDADDSWDIATVGVSTGSLCVTLADGAGGWLPPVAHATLPDSARVVAADLDGDGRTDLAVASTDNTSDSVGLHFGLGAGDFTPAQPVITGYDATSIAPGDLDGDERTDLVVSSEANDFVTALRNRGISPWTPLGNGLAGSHGVPLLDGSGTLQPGEPVSLALSRAVESALSVLVIGTGTVSAPFKGGVVVPAPQLLLAVPIYAYGQFVLEGVWPAGLPSGATIFMQDWVPDAAAVQGWAASGALSATTP